MKNSTALKMKQIPEGYLISGIDPHKKTHVAVLKTQDAVVHCKFKIPNSRRGFDELLERIGYWMKRLGCRGVIFAIEAGGRYWQPLAHFLAGKDIPFRLVSPFTLKRRREGDDVDRRKNDYHDAETGAELLRTGSFTETKLPQGTYAEVRAAYHAFHRLGEEITQTSNLLGSLLDAVFPEFGQVFKDIDGKTALAVLGAYPLPHLIAAMTLEEFEKAMTARCQGMRIVRKKLAPIHEVACDSIGIRAGSNAVASEIVTLVERLRLLGDQKDMFRYMLISLLESLPESRCLLSIDGIGYITVAGLLGELGPISNYSYAEQLVKMGGINPVQSESAGKRGRTPMSKKGRPLLRHCLWEACSSLLRYNASFRAWYRRLLERSVYNHPLNKREARGAMCRKLLHLVFALVKNGTLYDANYGAEETVSAAV